MGFFDFLMGPGNALQGVYNPQPATPGILTEYDVMNADTAAQQEIKAGLSTSAWGLGPSPISTSGFLGTMTVEHLPGAISTYGGANNMETPDVSFTTPVKNKDQSQFVPNPNLPGITPFVGTGTPDDPGNEIPAARLNSSPLNSPIQLKNYLTTGSPTTDPKNPLPSTSDQWGNIAQYFNRAGVILLGLVFIAGGLYLLGKDA